MIPEWVIEVSARGHTVKVLEGDHPLVGASAWFRCAVCSCGETQTFRDEAKSRNQSRAEQWAWNHTAHSTRPKRDWKWTRLNGWIPKRGDDMNRKTIEGQIAAAESRTQALYDQLALIEALPDEPRLLDDMNEPNVIWFEKTFGRDRNAPYTYAAVRANDGLWYTTGPRTPKGQTWDDLIVWVKDGEPADQAIWWGLSWEAVV